MQTHDTGKTHPAAGAGAPSAPVAASGSQPVAAAGPTHAERTAAASVGVRVVRGGGLLARIVALLLLDAAAWAITLVFALYALGGALYGWPSRSSVVVSFAWILLLLALCAVLPWRRLRAPGGIAAPPEQQPLLWEEVRHHAADAGTREPGEVRLTWELAVTVVPHRRGALRRRHDTVMIGFPLIGVLTVDELGAMIAAAYAMHRSDDTRLGGPLHRRRLTMLEAVVERDTPAGLPWRMVRGPGILLARMHVKLGDPVARRQVLSGDATLTELLGSVRASALFRRLVALQAALERYVVEEVSPVLRQGVRPPIIEGLFLYTGRPAVRLLGETALGSPAARRRTAASSPEPSLVERLEFMSSLDEPGVEPSPGPALGLLNTPGESERRLAFSLPGAPVGGALPLVPWREVGMRAVLPALRRGREPYSALLTQYRVGEPPATAERIEQLVRLVMGGGEQDRDEAHSRARHLIGASMVATLAEDGWVVQSAPGQPIRCVRDGQEVQPFAVVEALASGRATEDAWRQRAESLGIDRLRLAPTPKHEARTRAEKRGALDH